MGLIIVVPFNFSTTILNPLSTPFKPMALREGRLHVTSTAVLFIRLTWKFLGAISGAVEKWLKYHTILRMYVNLDVKDKQGNEPENPNSFLFS